MGGRSFFGVLGSRKSLPACEAVFWEVMLRSAVFGRAEIIHQGGGGAGGAYSEPYRLDKACARERSGGVKRAAIWSRNA